MMNKQLRNKHGKRVHFSIPDREWLWFTMGCDAVGKEPLVLLQDIAARKETAAEVKERVRVLITRALSKLEQISREMGDSVGDR